MSRRAFSPFLMAVPLGAPTHADVARVLSNWVANSGLPGARLLGLGGRIAGDEHRLFCHTDDDLVMVLHREASAPASAMQLLERLGRAWHARGAEALREHDDPSALIVWDRRAEQVTMRVDRFGVASLFVRRLEGGVLLSNCTGPLLAGTVPEFDRQALPDIVAMRFLHTAQTPWVGLRQVPTGRAVSLSTVGEREQIVSTVAYTARDPRRPVPSVEAVRRDLRVATATLQAAILARFEQLREQRVEDVVVPLSGGIDSSVVVALAAQVFPRCRAVTIEMTNFGNPELERSREVARRVGVPLDVVTVADNDVARWYPDVLRALEEPPRHFNNVAVLRMLEHAREHAGVVLSGDTATIYGANTVERLARQRTKQRWLHRIPTLLRPALASALRKTRVRQGRALADLLTLDIPALVQRSRTIPLTPAGQAVLPEAARSGVPGAACRALLWPDDQHEDDAAVLWTFADIEHPILRRNTRLGALTGMTYDYPLQDPAGVALAQGMPPHARWDPESRLGKPTLRALCAQLLGDDVAAWPKLGFPTPELAWMKGPLSGALSASLAADSPLASLVDHQALRKLPSDDNHQLLWTMMTLDGVLRRFPVTIR
jgi:asparagine synthetase B (glutamine-hydrolysing)